jgi:hypothetical protein
MLSLELKKQLKSFVDSTNVQPGDLCKFHKSITLSTNKYFLYASKLNADLTPQKEEVFDTVFPNYSSFLFEESSTPGVFLNEEVIYVYIKPIIQTFSYGKEYTHVIMHDGNFLKITNGSFCYLRKVII